MFDLWSSWCVFLSFVQEDVRTFFRYIKNTCQTCSRDPGLCVFIIVRSKSSMIPSFKWAIVEAVYSKTIWQSSPFDNELQLCTQLEYYLLYTCS